LTPEIRQKNGWSIPGNKPANAGSRGSFTILKMQDCSGLWRLKPLPHFLVPFMQHPVTNKPTMFSVCDQVANMSTFALETSAGLL